jgi:hypothetical protein
MKAEKVANAFSGRGACVHVGQDDQGRQGFPDRDGLPHARNPELCLLAARGKGVQRLRRDMRELIVSPQRKHSQEPDEPYERVERLWPGPYLELVTRNRRSGWQALGNEVDSGPIMRRRWPSNSYPVQASLGAVAEEERD